MNTTREPFEELVLVYECQNCHMIIRHGFVTKHDETITNQDELEKVIESVPCRFCREEKLKFKERHIIIRRRER